MKRNLARKSLVSLIGTACACIGHAQTAPALTTVPTFSLLEKNGHITPQKQQAVAAARRSTRTLAPMSATAGAAPMAMAMPGQAPRYFSHPNYANSPLPIVDPTTMVVSGGIRKFVDTLPGLTSGAANNLGQYLPVAVPDTTRYPGSDYYEIGLVQYRERMHSDLPSSGTLLRGYVQLGGSIPLANAMMDGTVQDTGRTGMDKPHYLGPVIIATKDRPVRIKFVNLLPKGSGGDLFVPVDTTSMGAGMGPGAMAMDSMTPQQPHCDMVPKPAECYTDNRATLHLHGGINPWISDGTPHQWITPAGEATSFPQGVSVVPVPDMTTDDNGNPTDGTMTFYWPNQQSARLMFYHDHAWGITRLNVYAGEAAGYLIRDEKELALVNGGVLPADEIPLVIQDKTFVPPMEQLTMTDETWNPQRWGGVGNLWLPHVYSPAQNPGDSSGVNEFGRWGYGPWFWPPATGIKYGPIANPYWMAGCDPNTTWCEPPEMPGTPFNSMGMEAFHDTPLVNGTAYPVLTVEPKAYRFRILNAANDRFVNLSLYKAVDAGGAPCNGVAAPAPESTGVACTEVALNPAEVQAALTDPAVVFPTPVAGTEGPSWIQVGSEGGFLPTPVTIAPQHITWVSDPTVFNAGNVDQHALLLGPAERADVVVDFSAYAGQTLILYNDAPAAFPARDPRYDYYTGNADLRDTGGTPPTLPGYGPNTRTVMQIKVASGTPAPFDLPKLNAAFAHKDDGSGVFESSQHPIIVGQGAYNSAYGTAFQDNGPAAGLAQIYDTSLSFKTLSGGAAGAFLTMPLQPKMIQDELGEAFEHDYGRMSGNLGVETPNAQAGNQNMILYPYTFPPTELLKGLAFPAGVAPTPIATTDDGTQLWKITHNGVDTHPIHFHLYDVQLINRVGWDGIVRKPDANELGWKDTVRVSPLEDTIVAMRPILPRLPFDLPNSVRLLDPSMPEGAVLASSTANIAAGKPALAFSPSGEPIDVINHKMNFGWEYVWHCHILSHEEMDMMRSQVFGVAPKAPTGLAAAAQGTTATLSWTDNSANETGFVVQRANDGGFASGLKSVEVPAGSVPAGSISYVDRTIKNNTTYFYRVFARNRVGDTWNYSDPALNNIPVGGGFPTMAVDSEFSNVVMLGNLPLAPAAPDTLATALQPGPQVRLTWRDRSNNETGFSIERATDGVTFSPLATVGTNVTNYVDTAVAAGNSYTYRVNALNGGGASPFSNTSAISIPLVAVPAAPSNLAATAVASGKNARVTLTWMDNATDETGFQVQRATNLNFTADVVNTNVAANVATLTTGNIARHKTYYFRARAFNSAGNSAWSNILIFTTP